MSRHVVSRPFVFVIFCVIWLIIRHRNHKVAVVFKQSVQLLDLESEIVDMFEHMPHGDNVESGVGECEDFLRCDHCFSKFFWSETPCVFTHVAAHHLTSVLLCIMQKIAYTTAEIEKVWFGMDAAKPVFIADINLFHLVVYPWHETFFMLVVAQIVFGFIIFSNNGLIWSGSGE